MTPQNLTLTEYQTLRLPREALDEALATRLWREYDAGRGLLHVGFPSPRSDGQWELTARGWVGHLPLGPQLALSLQPRVPVANLFRMLEVAYDLGSFHFLDGLAHVESVRDLYRRLAVALARGVLARAQHGFYRAYVDRQQRLPYLRGRVDVHRGARQATQSTIPCRYQEATGDVLHNQILAWTLHTIACSGVCYGDESSQSLVRRAYHRLNGVASLRPLPATACDQVHYQRLNDDYRPLHALCRFFLEQAGPGHRSGDHEMLPFLLNMALLYERFVAEWLRAHLPAPWFLSVQEQVPLGTQSTALAFYPDLVLYDGGGQARVVLDTKYRGTADGRGNAQGRQTAIPDTSEVAQALAYAQSKGCAEAVLVYPQAPLTPFEVDVGGVRVRALSFALDGDLEEAGRALQNQILPDALSQALGPVVS